MSRESKREIMAGIECERSKIVANNTVMYHRKDGTSVYRLHQTDIMEMHPNGDVLLNSGGWQTVTTKDRMNNLSTRTQFKIWQKSRVWHVSVGGQDYLFQDGMIIHPDGTVTGAGKEPDKTLIKKIREYANGMAEALPLPAPDGGDCWGCLMHKEGVSDPYDFPMGTDHLVSHFGGMEDQPDPYYVPSLLMRVLGANGVIPGRVQGSAWGAYAFGQIPIREDDRYTRKTFSRWVYKFLYSVLIQGRKS